MAIKNLICDLGGVWLPIDEKRTLAAFAALTGGDSADTAGGPNSRQCACRSIRHLRYRRRKAAAAGASAVAGGENAMAGVSAADSANAAAVHALAARLQPDVLAYELGAIDTATLLSRLRNALTAANAKTPAHPDAQADTRPTLDTASKASAQTAAGTAQAANAAPAAAPSDEALIQAWNAMLLPFPEAHLPLLDAYGQRYRLFLLSNTNALHIQQVEKDFQSRFPGRKPFLQHFEKAYLSHELHLRKPQPDIYTHVLRDAGLRPEETLFIDDRAENIAAAAALGIHTRLHPANAPLTTLPL